MKASPELPSREPNLFFAANEHRERLTNERLLGPVDLIVEDVSDDSVSRARVHRFEEYQVAGVHDYRIVDLRPNK